MHTHRHTHTEESNNVVREDPKSSRVCIVMAMRQCGNERLWAGQKDCGQIGEIVGRSGRLWGSQGDCGEVRETVGRSAIL